MEDLYFYQLMTVILYEQLFNFPTAAWPIGDENSIMYVRRLIHVSRLQDRLPSWLHAVVKTMVEEKLDANIALLRFGGERNNKQLIQDVVDLGIYYMETKHAK